MGFFFRRRMSIGPFRINLSKSGVGASVGVRGARLTMTPRGTTYVTVGSHGFYYRESLSSRGRSGDGSVSPPPPPSPISEVHSEEIPTADVSDLVDSSAQTLIQRLNERAKTSNPAWLVYIFAVALVICACIAFFPMPDYNLPELASPLVPQAVDSPVDEYSEFVLRYGYPNSVLANDLLNIVPIRKARYESVHTEFAFTPNACVAALNEAIHNLTQNPQRKELAQQKVKKPSPCTSPANAPWTLVGYSNLDHDENIARDEAVSRLDDLATKLLVPPPIKTPAPLAVNRRSAARTVNRKGSHPTSLAELPPLWPNSLRKSGQCVLRKTRAQKPPLRAHFISGACGY